MSKAVAKWDITWLLHSLIAVPTGSPSSGCATGPTDVWKFAADWKTSVFSPTHQTWEASAGYKAHQHVWKPSRSRRLGPSLHFNMPRGARLSPWPTTPRKPWTVIGPSSTHTLFQLALWFLLWWQDCPGDIRHGLNRMKQKLVFGRSRQKKHCARK